MRNILLLEPNYQNKYPPIGLMKIATYHRILGDKVRFFKGNLRELEFSSFDRVYVTTLFTFYWKITIDTINFAKRLVKNNDQLLIGGVMATLLNKEIELETGIKPHKGLLDKPGILDNMEKAKDIIIDDLPLDYSILDEINYEYPTRSAYFTFMTKGCTRKCAFCSVPILEPEYKPKIETIDKFGFVKNKFGEQQHLLLMDNNVLASPRFGEIIDEIKEMGFAKGATYTEPNQLEIAINNLRNGDNDIAYIRRINNLLNKMSIRLKNDVKSNFDEILNMHDLTKKEELFEVYNKIGHVYEKYRIKSSKQRFVDFNQGTDARYVTDEIMKKMSEIAIRPLRIAFDYIGMKDQYENAIRLAAKYGINDLSNYILYNFVDSPEHLYQRLLININLAKELGVKIYSFPMKYIPLFGEDAKSRKFIGKKWNKKFIRAIQSILNVTRGIVASGDSLFYRTFGKNEDEYREILYMPENFIIYRKEFEDNGNTELWRKEFRSLTDNEKLNLLPKIESNNFVGDHPFLRHYLIKKGKTKEKNKEICSLVKKDQFVQLTLTFDFE